MNFQILLDPSDEAGRITVGNLVQLQGLQIGPVAPVLPA
jgi:hypothetical protein